VVLFAALALYLGGTMFKLVMQEITLVKQGQILQAEKAAVMAQHDELNAQIAQAKTNAGIERLAREQLGLVMPQEIPVKTAAAPPPEPVKADVAPAGKPAVGLPPAMAALAKFFTP
jgi:cell division protein FtsB